MKRLDESLSAAAFVKSLTKEPVTSLNLNIQDIDSIPAVSKKDLLEKRADELYWDTIAYIKEEITKYCVENGCWFESLVYTRFYNPEDVNKDEIDNTETEKLLNLVFWCRDITGRNIMDCYYRNGEWKGMP